MKIKKEIISFNYNPGNLCFGTLNQRKISSQPWNIKRWDYCREQFQKIFKVKCLKYMLFSLRDKSNYNSLVEFIYKFENKLKIKNKTEFRETNRENVVWIKVSPFWVARSMRFSLFTILLRCGINYKGNFRKALDSYNYSKNTIHAIFKFLKGYTHYTGNPRGWHDKFRKKTYYGEIRKNYENNLKFLVKP